MWTAMIKFIVMFITRISVAVLTICVLIVFSVLTFTTPPAMLPSKQNGQTVFVVGYVQNSIAGQSAYSLASFGMRNSIYVVAAVHSPPIQLASLVTQSRQKIALTDRATESNKNIS